MLIPVLLFDYVFIRGGGYFSSAELWRTFPKTWLCTSAFVLIIIAEIYDESLISSNKSSFQDVKASGQGWGCVFEVKSGSQKRLGMTYARVIAGQNIC